MAKSIQYERGNRRLRARAKKVYCERTQHTRLMKAVVTGWGGVTVVSSSEAYMFEALNTHLSVHSILMRTWATDAYSLEMHLYLLAARLVGLLFCHGFLFRHVLAPPALCVLQTQPAPLLELNRNISLIVLWSVEFLTTSRTMQWSNLILRIWFESI